MKYINIYFNTKLPNTSSKGYNDMKDNLKSEKISFNIPLELRQIAR